MAAAIPHGVDPHAVVLAGGLEHDHLPRRAVHGAAGALRGGNHRRGRYGRRVRHIMLPLISPFIFFQFVMSFIYAMQAFLQPYILNPPTYPRELGNA